MLTRADVAAAQTPTVLHEMLGVTIVAGPDETEAHFTVRDPFCNRHGVLHGGIICLLFDITMGRHLRASLGPAITVELKTQFLRPAGLGPIVCRARFLKQGRAVSFLTGDITDAGGKTIAAATATWMLLEPR